MPLQKQPVNINFASGLDLKTDPNQVPLGKFLALENAVFQNGGGLQKRNGFGSLTTLSNTSATGITTLNGNLLATGPVLQAYSSSTDTWLNRGSIQPVNIATLPLVRSSLGQTKPDVAVSSSGVACAVWVENSLPYYSVYDAESGQVIVSRTALPATAVTPRVISAGPNLIISFIATVSAASTLQYIAIPVSNPSAPTAATNISTSVAALATGYDLCYNTDNGNVYFAWSDGSGTDLKMAYLNSSLIVSSPTTFAGKVAAALAITVDTVNNTVWVAAYVSATTKIWTLVTDYNTNQVHTFVEVMTGDTITHVSIVASAGVATIFWDVQSTYSWGTIRSDYIRSNTCTESGTAGTAGTVLRSVQLASKSFYSSAGVIYMLACYGAANAGLYQPTYFLIDSSGNAVAKLAYSNGGGYYTDQKLPQVSSVSGTYYIGYLFKDLIVPVSKANGATTAGAIYSQTGLNLAAFQINSTAQFDNEIAQSLHLTGGFEWQYDGAIPVEHGFHLYPEDLKITEAGGGSIAVGDYYYIACYEWTDSAGNIHRSAGNIPTVISSRANATNTIKVPTARITYKGSINPIRIVLYRSSAAQPIYYQVTSISAPTANVTTADSVTITDTAADATIAGSTILYTTGGVVENIAAPAFAHTALYKSRLIGIDSEDRNLLWYSKQVIEATPVEFSDLFTIYVAPTSGAQGPTGDMKAVSAMDDKLIIFKSDAIYYITGTGPDNTGANNDFSEPVYITGTVGTSVPASIVFTPIGLMFQSDKGIWLLGRDLSTKYVGADVEAYNNSAVINAICVPGTNQVRFTLDSGTVLMYDYFYNQWGTFSGIPSLDSTLFQGKHTYLAANGILRQETSDLYLDGSRPVLLKFTTNWIKLAGLQGYQRAYAIYLLNQYISPYKQTVSIAYDYATSPSQSTVLTPAQASNSWGSENLWGGGTWGIDTLDQRRVFLDQQRCQALQITVQESFDASQGYAAGAGFTCSGIQVLAGIKSGSPKLSAKQSAG